MEKKYCQFGMLEAEQIKESQELHSLEASIYEHHRGPDYENLIKLACWVLGSVGIVFILCKLAIMGGS